MFILLSTIIDITNILFYGWKEYISSVSLYGFPQINISLILFALLNGFYEEIFFLGICIHVKKEYRIISLVYSLIIRTLFHTYYGLFTALEIGLVIGIIYYIFYKRNKNLYPFMMSHTIADIVSLGIIQLL
ncbi:CPBP family intramembrane glutamic endopeptidase [[Clostridium] colinum]|uniref:CPBP family intramembrane glutamic endopeptidase n=1 Tax=[Clostridium] colinum TaxID=36835 RepID=UPI0020247419|nr:CPBP family intramembrane glutamic endopeptidase [[Clostridium] colinum]